MIKNPSQYANKPLISSVPVADPSSAASTSFTTSSRMNNSFPSSIPAFNPSVQVRVNYFTNDKMREGALRSMLLFMLKTVYHFNNSKTLQSPESIEGLRPKFFILSSFSLFYKYYFDIETDFSSKPSAFTLACIYIAGKVRPDPSCIFLSLSYL